MALKVAVIGLGAVFEERHGPALAQLCIEGHAEVVGLCDRDPRRRARFERWQVEPGTAAFEGKSDPHIDDLERYDRRGVVHADWREMLADAQPDVCFLFLPPGAHGEVELELAAMGIPFLVEKPLGIDLETPKAIAEAVQAKGLVTSSGFLERYGDHASWVRRFVETRRIRHVSIGDYNPTNVRGRWTAQRELSRSFHLEHVIHQLDLVRYFGEEPVRVCSFESEKEPQPGHDMPWGYATIYKLSGGGTMSIEDVRTYGWDKAWQRWQRLELVDVTIDWKPNRVLLNGKEVWAAGGDEVYGQTFSNLFYREQKAFLDAVEANNSGMVRSSYGDALHSHAAMLAAVVSAERGGVAIDIAEWSGLPTPEPPEPWNRWEAWSTPKEPMEE